MTITEIKLIITSSREKGRYDKRGAHEGPWVIGNISFVDLVAVIQFLYFIILNCQYTFLLISVTMIHTHTQTHT